MSINPVRLASGACLLLLGVALLLDQLAIVPATASLRYWPVGLVMLGLGIVAQAVMRPSAEPETRDHNHFGGAIALVLVVAVMGAALSRPRSAAPSSEGRLQMRALLGGDRRTVSSEAFTGADMTAILGGTDLDLRHASIPAETPVSLDVFAFWGGVNIRVPSDWIVDLQVDAILGGVTDRRARAPETTGGAADKPGSQVASRPRVIIRGKAVMGGVQIRN